MTPIRRYVQAQVTSGGLRAEVHYREHEMTDPSVGVELTVTGTPILTVEALTAFTAEVTTIAEEEAKQSGGGNPRRSE